ncbi:MAG: hypothetical protein H7833_12545 [Magnetococcus sp. DMHC-1]
MPTLTMQAADLQRVADLIHTRLGFSFTEPRWPDLLRLLKNMASSCRFPNLDACIQWVLSDIPESERLEQLARYITIGETYFFREQDLFSFLQSYMIPERLRAKKASGQKKITFWSAGCSSGEEPYSVAMLVDRMPATEGLDIQVLASDINDAALEKAQKGIYSLWSFRNPAAHLRINYFSEIDNKQLQISNLIRDKVLFFKLNLISPVFSGPLASPGSVDILFCRNVLMYFDQEYRQLALDHLVGRLGTNGWLVVSPCEAPLIEHPALTAIHCEGMHLFRKRLATPGKSAVATFEVNRFSRTTFFPEDNSFLCQPDLTALTTPSTRLTESTPVAKPYPVAKIEAFQIIRTETFPPTKTGSFPSAMTEAFPTIMTGSSSSAMTGSFPLATTKTHAATASRKNPTVGSETVIGSKILSLANTLLEQGASQRAILLLQDLLASPNTQWSLDAPRHQAVALLAGIHADQGNLDIAEQGFREAIAADKLNPQYYHHLAMIMLARGNRQQAIDLCKKVLFLDQDFILAHFQLATLAVDPHEATRYLNSTRSLIKGLPVSAVIPHAEGMTVNMIQESLTSLQKGLNAHA